MARHTIIDNLEQLASISNELFPPTSDDRVEFRRLKQKLSGTSGFTFKWRECNGICCPGYYSKTLNSSGLRDNNAWKLKVSSSKTRCFCCCSPKQNLIFSDAHNGEEIMRISYEPDVWTCCPVSKTGQARQIQVYVLGQTEPIGKIEYDSAHKLDKSATLWNSVTNEVFKTQRIFHDSATGMSMQVNNALGLPVGVASVTGGVIYRGETTFTDYQVLFPSGSLSPTTKCLMLALSTMWTVDQREKQFKGNCIWIFITLLVSFIIVGIVLAATL